MKRVWLGVLAAGMVGCGMIEEPLMPMMWQGQSLPQLQEGFGKIHEAIFAKKDLNKDGGLTEAEAAPNLDLREFRRADGDRNGVLSYAEFEKWARLDVLAIGLDSPERFAKRTRDKLRDDFFHLDRDEDGLLSLKDLNPDKLQKRRFRFVYPSIRFEVAIGRIAPEDFAAADETKDNWLVESEFENLYVMAVLRAINEAPFPLVDRR